MDSGGLMDTLSRLSSSIDEAMKQKRSVEKRLSETMEQVKVLIEANNALVDHVARLEKHNDVIVKGLEKIVCTVDQNCQKMHDAANTVGSLATKDDTASISSCGSNPEKDSEDDIVPNTKTETADVLSSTERASEPTLKEQENGAADLDREPQSAELKSFSALHIDPLVFSDVRDYAADPDHVVSHNHARNSSGMWNVGLRSEGVRSNRVRSGRLGNGRFRSGRIRLSRALFRSSRQEPNLSSSTTEESHQSRMSDDNRHGEHGMPVPKATCGCFLKTIFGRRH